MIESGWTSASISRYAWHRYGEEIPDATIRSYKKRRGIEARPAVRFGGVQSPDEVLDVVGLRRELIELQMARIGIDWNHEQALSKLFGTNKGEIALLNELLDDHRTDLQSLGMFPIAGREITVRSGVPADAAPDLPTHRTLADAMGADLTAEAAAAVAKVIHLSSRKAASDE